MNEPQNNVSRWQVSDGGQPMGQCAWNCRHTPRRRYPLAIIHAVGRKIVVTESSTNTKLWRNRVLSDCGRAISFQKKKVCVMLPSDFLAQLLAISCDDSAFFVDQKQSDISYSILLFKNLVWSALSKYWVFMLSYDMKMNSRWKHYYEKGRNLCPPFHASILSFVFPPGCRFVSCT